MYEKANWGIWEIDGKVDKVCARDHCQDKSR